MKVSEVIYYTQILKSLNGIESNYVQVRLEDLETVKMLVKEGRIYFEG